MPTDALPRPLPADVGSPWRRLYWTLPLALAICALTVALFGISMEHAAPRPPQAAPVDAQLIELPPGAPAQQPAEPPRPAPPPTPQADALPTPTQPAPAAPPVSPPVPAAPAAPVTIQSRAAHTVSQPMPVIPDELRDEAMHERATARFHIAADGSVTVELVQPTQNPRLNRLLLEALRRWKFDPALQDGKPVPSTQDIVIRVQVD